MRAALVAIVAVLIRRFALGTRALDEPVGQKRAGHRVVKLRRHRFSSTRPALRSAAQISPHSSRFSGAVRAAVVVELDVEAGEIAHVVPRCISAISSSSLRPSCRARIMIAVPCVSSAQM